MVKPEEHGLDIEDDFTCDEITPASNDHGDFSHVMLLQDVPDTAASDTAVDNNRSPCMARSYFNKELSCEDSNNSNDKQHSQSPSPNTCDTEVKDILNEVDQIVVHLSSIHNLREETSEALIPEYAVVNKAKRTSKTANSEIEHRNLPSYHNKSLNDKKQWDPYETSLPLTDHRMYNQVQERCSSPEYAEVMMGKKEDKSLEVTLTEDESSIGGKNVSNDYDKLLDTDTTSLVTKQHYYHSLENPYVSTGTCEGSSNIDFSMLKAHHLVIDTLINPYEIEHEDM